MKGTALVLYPQGALVADTTQFPPKRIDVESVGREVPAGSHMAGPSPHLVPVARIWLQR